ncbi:glycosyltransferase family 2 protein [Tenacibaculum aquimarinum]|uniref:glycosyltransferase family 2 protein n=1 Tax=Tenacibaculum aquimarinum TaxID=2910675 RepID=UPI001F0AD56A|nr:glycosyltransferase family 2 protein [Tenacibaculum aquimarinum]MCH3885333.1 glycosyltransferase family 2 protein [Tenacibaculum aquimarinum]
MTKITAIIPTLNEQDNIQRAINSVLFADEVIVIDSFSTDETVAIVKKNKNVTLLQRKFDDFSTQKNYAIEKATHNWVLVLDADEELPKKLQKEIKNTVENPKDFVAFYIRRNFFYRGTKINFSGFRTSKVKRLFLKNECEYKGVVHEELNCNGKISFFKNKLNHYSYKNSEHYKQKLHQYAQLQANELFAKGKKATPFHTIIKPIARFFIHYIIRLGIFDGIKGLQLSYLMAYGVSKRYEYLNEIYDSRR